MGLFVQEKNFHCLVKALSSFKQSGYQRVIAGDADIEEEYSKQLKRLAKENDVILTGFIKGAKLQALLSHAALFVLPSSHEGLPISLLEAMSYGLPVLASDIPANKEVNLPASCYFHYDRNIIHNLSEALNQKIRDNSIPCYDLARYNWDNIADQTIEIYRKYIHK